MDQQEEERQFYEAYGRSLSQWAMVELHLSYVFSILLQPKDPAAASVVFYAIENFRSKVEATNRLADFKLTGTVHLPDWKELQEQIVKASKTRNNLAHYTAICEPQRKEGERYLLKPTVYNPSNAKKTHGYSTKDFQLVNKEFFNVFIGLMNFAARIFGHPEPHPGWYVKKSRKPLNQTKADQNPQDT